MTEDMPVLCGNIDYSYYYEHNKIWKQMPAVAHTYALVSTAVSTAIGKLHSVLQRPLDGQYYCLTALN